MGRLFRFLPPLFGFLREHGTDLLAVAGIACVVQGVRSWSAPAAWLLLGVFLLVTAWRLE